MCNRQCNRPALIVISQLGLLTPHVKPCTLEARVWMGALDDRLRWGLIGSEKG